MRKDAESMWRRGSLAQIVLWVASLLLAWCVETGFLNLSIRLSASELVTLQGEFAAAATAITESSLNHNNTLLCLILDKDDFRRLKKIGEGATEQNSQGRSINGVCSDRLPDRKFLGYRITSASASTSRPTDAALYEVNEDDFLGGLWGIKDIVSKVFIKASIDTMLRSIERTAFNPPDAEAELKLCSGSRSLPATEECRLTSQLKGIFAPPMGIVPSAGGMKVTLASIIDNRRLASLFFGAVQFGTLTIFVFSLLETGSLWIVHVRASEGKKLEEGMYVTALQSSGNGRQRAAAIGIIESLRSAVSDDAVVKQEKLEVLGDTMLKLAFLGTVYGISAALFSARSLDTADPVAKLMAKSEMYSGIGVGFGTTLVGISLSILAAVVRNGLGASWHRRIDVAYNAVIERINKLGTDELVAASNEVASLSVKPIDTRPPVIPIGPDPLSRGFRGLAYISCLIGVVVFAYTLLKKYHIGVG